MSTVSGWGAASSINGYELAAIIALAVVGALAILAICAALAPKPDVGVPNPTVKPLQASSPVDVWWASLTNEQRHSLYRER